jgi:hypothetical protein
MMKEAHTSRGFLTLELLLAITVFAIMMSGVFAVASGGQTMGTDVGLSKGGIGYTLSSIQQKTQLASVLSGFNALVNSTSTSDVYVATTTITSVSPCMKAVTQSSGWGSEYKRSLSVSLSTLVPSLDIAQQFGGGCDPLPPGSWDTPRTYGGLSSSDFSGQGTGVAAASIGGTRYAFLTTDTASQDDFYVIDVSNPETLSPSNVIASIDVGEGLNGITLGKINDTTYAFLLNNSNSGQLQVYDVSTNPAVPAFVASSTLPNISTTCSPASSPCRAGQSIFFNNGKLYVGTKYFAFGALGTNHEFHIFDVSNPSNPLWPVWSTSINVDRDVNDIAVANGYAYLATGPGSPPAPYTPLKAYDLTSLAPISNAFTITLQRKGTDVFILGNTLYLGLERGSSGENFYILNISNPAVIPATPLGKKSLDGNTTETGGLMVQGKYAFIGMLGTNSQDAFQVLDVSNPGSPLRINTCTAGVPFPQGMTDVAYMDNYAFASFRSNVPFYVIYDRSDLSCP